LFVYGVEISQSTLLPITFHILGTVGKPLMSRGTPSGFVWWRPMVQKLLNIEKKIIKNLIK
jgi:hypothetical protein